jgi:hypothetical protein
VNRLIFCLALLLGIFSASQNDCLAAASDEPRTKTTIEPKQDVLNPPVDMPTQKYKVTLWVNVPHVKNCREKFRAVPYLTEVPTALVGYGPLAEKYSDIKNQLSSYCYLARQNPNIHAYLGAGWRSTYCLQAAMREAGLGQPHLVTEVNQWCEDMYPYLHKYVVRSNNAEDARKKRYSALVDRYNEEHTDIEYQALKKGYYPIDLDFTVYHLTLRRTIVDLPEGTWWITGTHAIIGVKYYWQEQIEVGPDKPNTLELTEQNAVMIDGRGW